MSLYLSLLSIILMLILISAYFIQSEHYKKKTRAIIAKALCTLIPVSLCLYGVTKTDTGGTKWFLFVGLCICLVADVTIEIDFFSGMLVFMFAHFCFIDYFLSLAPPKWYSLLVFVLLYVCAVAGFMKFLPALGKRAAAFLLYPAILITMFSLAVLLPFSLNNIGTVFIAVGAGLFAISDMILGLNTLGKFSGIKARFVIYLYYSGIFLLSASTFYM